MPIALGTLLALVSIAVIAYPFLGSKRYRLVSERFVTREKLRAERLRIYRKITDVEADFASGDLTEADYQYQRDQLRTLAAKILRQESGATTTNSKRDEELEKEISRLREQTVQSLEGGDTL
jgi:alpha-D-ribose 1-methylphosphonate 5-triphosphate synthase subunit PhnI